MLFILILNLTSLGSGWLPAVLRWHVTLAVCVIRLIKAYLALDGNLSLARRGLPADLHFLELVGMAVECCESFQEVKFEFELRKDRAMVR